jgi:K+-sensing histidine kinase KdpD
MANPNQPTLSVERFGTLNRLLETSLVLNSSLSVDQILSQLMDAAAEVLQAESASVILRDMNSNELHFVAMPTDSKHSERLVRIPVPMEGSIAGSIIMNNETIVLDDVTQDPRHYRQADEASGFVVRSLCGVPIKINGENVGALEAVNKIGDHWEEDDASILQILSSQAAIAIQKAQLIEDLQKANKELSQLDKLKSDFIAIASHELRTPLGVIMGYASFLKEEAQGEMGDHANAVLNSALRMRSLIEDMMSLRFLNMGESELYFEAVAVSEILHLLQKDDVMQIIEAKQHQIEFIGPNDEVVVPMDRAKMVLALTNLLNNAVKFTPPQEGRIQLKVSASNNEVRFSFTDNGVGIPSEHVTDIFKPFHQVEDHMTRRHGGMGLGLSISQAVIEAHGGRIWAESAGQDQGSTFTVVLPIERV